MRIASYRTGQRFEVGVVSHDGRSVTPFDLPPERAANGLLAVNDGGHSLLPLRDETHSFESSGVTLLAPIPAPR